MRVTHGIPEIQGGGQAFLPARIHADYRGAGKNARHRFLGAAMPLYETHGSVRLQ